MCLSNLPGSGNSLVGYRDDGETYREMQRCKHCSETLDYNDALDTVCNGCLKNEKLEWQCNDCDHIWISLGISMQCPSCQSFNLDSVTSMHIDKVRHFIILNEFIQKQNSHETEKAIVQFSENENIGDKIDRVYDEMRDRKVGL